ncbi:hypothetical protein ACFV6B_20535 [Streptomyces microflavus]|uniref:hypothetical protein n=1 Tax=Streptomyces microflavus TaxID=1919 RepID=UPI003653722B
MENWREGAQNGHTHESNDVTIQLDGLGRQLAELPGEPVPAGGSDGPVFVDESGRRSKTYRRLGWVVAALCAAYAVTLVFAVLGGNSTAPWLPLSGQKEEAKAEEAEVRPVPSDSAEPSDDLDPAPGATGPSGTPEPGASGAAEPSATSVTVPAGSAGRTPSASTSVTPPGTTGGATKPAATSSAPKPPVSTPPPSPEPEPTVSTSAPAETPEPPVLEESAL